MHLRFRQGLAATSAMPIACEPAAIIAKGHGHGS
jgi:hypothetical protein